MQILKMKKWSSISSLKFNTTTATSTKWSNLQQLIFVVMMVTILCQSRSCSALDLAKENLSPNFIPHYQHHNNNNNNNNQRSRKNIDSSDDDSFNGPKIITKHVYITSYEHQTVVLPCSIENLPHDMHVIWQYGKREESNQVVLTIGRTQIENNYRVRVISNSSSDQSTFERFFLPSQMDHVPASTPSSLIPKRVKPSKITSNNLEIRKLQLADSGWYECQLPTKPTQKNYVHLEVLSYPRIESSLKHVRVGDNIELKCHVKNLPSKYEIYWMFNEKKIEDPKVVNKRLSPLVSSASSLKHFSSGKYTVLTEQNQNISVSTLKIVDLEHQNKGVYKCKYDKAEAKYHLDFKTKNKIKHQSDTYDQPYSSGANSMHFKAGTVIFYLIGFIFMMFKNAY